MIRAFDVRDVAGLALMYTATTDDGIAVRFTGREATPAEMQSVFDALAGKPIGAAIVASSAAGSTNGRGGATTAPAKQVLETVATATLPAQAPVVAVADVPRDGRKEFLETCKAHGFDLGADRTTTARKIVQLLVTRLATTHPANFEAEDWNDAADALRAHLSRPSHIILPGEPAQERPGMGHWVEWCEKIHVNPRQLGLYRTAGEMATLCGSTLARREVQDWVCADWRRLCAEMTAWIAENPDVLIPGEDPFADE